MPLDTGRKIAPAPATFALAVAMDGKREPNADAEGNVSSRESILPCIITLMCCPYIQPNEITCFMLIYRLA